MRSLLFLMFFVVLAVGVVSRVSARSGVTVNMTAQGFEPNSVTINSGESVTWVNRDSRSHWPASNPHPVHTGYPLGGGCAGSKFDACHGLLPWESYTFVLDKVGVWGVHDHLNPGMLMQVRVVDHAEEGLLWSWAGRSFYSMFSNVVAWAGSLVTLASPTKLDPKAPSLENFRAESLIEQEKTLKDLTAQSPQFGWKYLKDAYLQNGKTVGNAHSLAHVVGNVLYQHQGIAGVKLCDASFAYGCFHGVTEQLLRDKGPVAVVEVERACIGNLSSGNQSFSGCIHGAGHGLLTWENMDVSKALADCDRFSSSVQNYCYDGVFMENAGDDPSKIVKGSSYWQLCGSVLSKYRFSCARYEAIGLISLPGMVINRVAEICAEAPYDDLARPCIDSLGYKAAQDARGGLAAIKKECGELRSKEANGECLLSAAIETKFQNYSGWEDVANEICGSLDQIKNVDCVKQVGMVRR
jgi:plastocyanin